MASELQVTTIRGVPTGANANQINIGSGQTLYAPGHVIQTLQVKGTGGLANNAASAWTNLMNINITPVSTSSKIQVSVIVCYGGTDNSYAAGRLLRTIGSSGTVLRNGNAHFTETRFSDASFGMQMNASANDQYKIWNTTYNYLDSPNTTSQITYAVEMLCDASYGSRIVYYNRSHLNPSDGYNPPPWSSITLQEIAQ